MPTFVLRDGKFIEKHKAPPKIGGAFFMPDLTPFVTQDGVEISSRSKLRAYEQANGVRQVGSDINSEIQRIKARMGLT